MSLATQNRFFSLFGIVVASLLYAFGIGAFVNMAGIFPMGLMSFANLTIYLSPMDISAYVSVIYLVYNIPLVALFWKKIKRKYIYRSVLFLFLQALFGLLFLIPSFKDFWIVSFWWDNPSLDFIREQRWPILLFAAIGACVTSLSTGIVWKCGGGTGGTDFVIYYYSFKHKKPIGKISLIVSLFMMVFSFAISIALNSPDYSQNLWFMILLGTLLYLFIATSIVDLIYPKYSKVKLEIFSSEPEKLSSYFKNSKFPHAWTIISFKSGYTHKDKKLITTTILLLELPSIIRKLYEIDNELWITVTKIKFNYGNFNTTSVDH